MACLQPFSSLVAPINASLAADVDCLEYLRNISSLDHTDGKGFTLKFEFNDNPYFENKILEKVRSQ